METAQGDPIIAEVWAVRDKFTVRVGYDVGALFRLIRELQVESGHEYVEYPARRTAEGSDEFLAV